MNKDNEIQLCIDCLNFLNKPDICRKCYWIGNKQKNHSNNAKTLKITENENN